METAKVLDVIWAIGLYIVLTGSAYIAIYYIM